MAAYNKFEQFVNDLMNGVHGDFDTQAISIYLSNAAPSASLDLIKTDLAEIATGNGYTGPIDMNANVSVSETGGTATLDISADEVITASGGSIGPFQYVVLFNDTPTSPADPLIGWWDHGSAVTLNDGESFTVDFGATLFSIA